MLWTDEVNATIWPTVNHEDGIIMLWGCVAVNGTGYTARVDKRMDSSKYQEILESKCDAGKWTMIQNIFQNPL